MSMIPINQHSSSFRDPFGYVYEKNGAIFRSISELGRQQYEAIRHSGVLQDLAARKWLVSSHEVDDLNWPDELRHNAYILQHNRIPFISYPYEWTFHQLKAAALLHLDLQAYLLTHNMVLKDGSAYNVQFIGLKPIFIDLLSIKPYEIGEYWVGHRQFCETFLNPLLLRAKLGVSHHHWYRGYKDGIPLLEIERILPFHCKLSWNVFTNIYLQARLQKKADRLKIKTVNSNSVQKPLSKFAYAGLISQMKNWIAGLKPKEQNTTWADYSCDHTYTDVQIEQKKSFVAAFIERTKPKLMVDLGCNDGTFSRLALQCGAEYVIGLDADDGALEQAYVSAMKYQNKFIPLYFDAANPSPNQGWQQLECLSLEHRVKADALLALAFIHHLVIARNIPISQLIHQLINLAPKGIIEFVPKNDSTVKKMLQFRQDIFADYTEENFEKCLLQHASIIQKQKIATSERVLYWYEKSV